MSVHALTNRTGSFLRVQYFNPTQRSLVVKTLLNNSKVIGEEITASLEALAYQNELALKTSAPSGFLSMGNASTSGDGLYFGSQPNAYAIDSGVAATPFSVIMNGHLVFIGGASTSGTDPYSFGDNNDRYCTITMAAAPTSGTRDDLVFIEFWFAEVTDGDTYYPWGSLQYKGDALVNDIVNTNFGSTVYNKDLVLKWKIRTVSTVDFSTYPFGVGATNVYGQGGAVSASTRNFTNGASSLNDSGIWVCGDGTDQARTDLGSTDGYTYAMPLQIVHRRNTAAWSATNPNGTNIALGGSSDRPDGLFYDQIAARDILDLRYLTYMNGINYEEKLETYKDKLYAGLAKKVMVTSAQNSAVKGNTIVYQEGITTASPSGIDVRFAPDAIRRVFSDLATDQATVGFLTTGSNTSTLGGFLTYTTSSKVVTITAPSTPSGVTVKNTTPTLKWVTTGGTAAITGSWSGLGGASATATLDIADGGWQAAGQFYVEFTLSYPANQGIKYFPDTVHRVDIATSTTMYLGTIGTDLNLTNLSGTGSYGIAINSSKRAILEIACRENITANGAGVAKSSGKVLYTSAGSISGGLVTGLSGSQNINVTYCYTPATSDTIRLFYSYIPYQCENGPTTLSLDIVRLENFIAVSILGIGGGSQGDGQPYTLPLVHIPENSSSTRDSQLINNYELELGSFSCNMGFAQSPVYFRDAYRSITSLTTKATDSEGRGCYTAGDVDMVCHSQDLNGAHWHRNILWGVAKITTASGDFLKNELVAVCFTDTSNDIVVRAGISTGSTMCAGIYKLNLLTR